MLQSFADTLQRMVAEAAAAQIFESLNIGGENGILSSIFSFGGGKAAGGPVSAGMFYEVGEANKPEIFRTGGRQYLIPGNQGEVMPIGAASGVVQLQRDQLPGVRYRYRRGRLRRRGSKPTVERGAKPLQHTASGPRYGYVSGSPRSLASYARTFPYVPVYGSARLCERRFNGSRSRPYRIGYRSDYRHG